MKKGFDFLGRVEREIVQSFVAELRDKLGEDVIDIVLFGSKARGDFSRESDIDIFVLVKQKSQRIREIIGDITAGYVFDFDIPLSPVVYDLEEFNQNKKLGSFFFENVEREGVAL